MVSVESVRWHRSDACCSFGMEENISAQVIAFMGVVWNYPNSKRLCTLVNFADFIKGVRKKWTCRPLSPFILCLPEKMLAIPLEVPSRHTNRRHRVSNRLHGSHTRTVTNYKAFITKCNTQSRHIRPWNLKKTKSSKRSKKAKLKDIFLSILIALKPR